MIAQQLILPKVKSSQLIDGGYVKLHLVIDPNDQIYRAHFPGNPIVPGAILVGWAAALIERFGPGIRVISELKRVKFTAPILPSNEVIFNFSPLSPPGWIKFYFEDTKCQTYASGQIRATKCGS